MMMKIFKSAGCLGAVLMTILLSCSCNKNIDGSGLPEAAQAFLSNYYAGVSVSHVERDVEDGVSVYEVYMANGHEITFGLDGNWLKVDAPDRAAIPAGIVPGPIASYLDAKFPGVGVNEIDRTSYGYEVDLLNSLDLKFDASGNVLNGGEQGGSESGGQGGSGEQGGTGGTGGEDPVAGLPEAAQAFLSKYYVGVSVSRVERDVEDGSPVYEVYMANGHEVTFGLDGNWLKVDAPDNTAIPTGIVPEAIASYLNANFPGVGVNEIDRTSYGYEVDLLNGWDLKFDAAGNVLNSGGASGGGQGGSGGSGEQGGTGGDPTAGLPEAAQAFLSNYYAGVSVSHVERDVEDGEPVYEVYMANGHEITFGLDGDWLKVDAPGNNAIPTGIVPEAIASYIDAKFPGVGVNEIDRTSYGYEVDLLNGWDLKFDAAGNVLNSGGQGGSGEQGGGQGGSGGSGEQGGSGGQGGSGEQGGSGGTGGEDPTAGLPKAAQAFLSNYYASVSVSRVERDVEDGSPVYEVYMANGHEVTFGLDGNWLKVDAPDNTAIPTGIVPEAIASYLNANFPGVGVNEIDRTSYGYEVDLLNGLDLKFNKEGERLQ